jgi:proteasome lid subunit RPN8/RPN11
MAVIFGKNKAPKGKIYHIACRMHKEKVCGLLFNNDYKMSEWYSRVLNEGCESFQEETAPYDNVGHMPIMSLARDLLL